MEPLQLKAQMMPATRRADGSVTIKLVTEEEIETDQFAAIDNYRQTRGWFLFRPNKFDTAEIPTDDADMDNEPLWKRQQRTIYKLFMLRGGKPAEFGQFYRSQMEKIQDRLGERIEEEELKHAPNKGK